MTESGLRPIRGLHRIVCIANPSGPNLEGIHTLASISCHFLIYVVLTDRTELLSLTSLRACPPQAQGASIRVSCITAVWLLSLVCSFSDGVGLTGARWRHAGVLLCASPHKHGDDVVSRGPTKPDTPVHARCPFSGPYALAILSCLAVRRGVNMSSGWIAKLGATGSTAMRPAENPVRFGPAYGLASRSP
jgi:hypothetical protein